MCSRTLPPESPDRREMHRLLGDDFSYYSGKARAYLKFKRIAFEEITPTPEVYRSVIIPRTGVKYIPVVITPNDVAIQDTTDIIDFFEDRYPEPAVYPATPRQRLAALLFEVYGDEWLLVAAMHYRWRHNYDFAISEFGRLATPEADEETRRRRGAERAKPFHGALPLLGITERTGPAIEAGYLELLDALNRHFQTLPYLLGQRPSLGDFGLIGPLYAHLYRDPASGALMRDKAPHVAGWVERMMNPDGPPGAFLDDDRVPETLFPVLRHMFAEHLPLLIDTAREVDRWLAAHAGDDIPRTIGEHEVSIYGVRERRAIFPYAQWMLQRPLTFYQAQTGNARRSLDTFLEPLGGLEAMQFQVPRPLVRRHNKLVPAAQLSR